MLIQNNKGGHQVSDEEVHTKTLPFSTWDLIWVKLTKSYMKFSTHFILFSFLIVHDTIFALNCVVH